MFGWQLTPPKSTDDFLRFVEDTRWERTPKIVRCVVEECLDAKCLFWNSSEAKSERGLAIVIWTIGFPLMVMILCVFIVGRYWGLRS